MSMPKRLLGRSRTWPLLATTSKSGPKDLLIVRALAGDSTMTRFFFFRAATGGSSSAGGEMGSPRLEARGACADSPPRRLTARYPAWVAVVLPRGLATITILGRVHQSPIL